MTLLGSSRGESPGEPYETWRLLTDRGRVETRWYANAGARAAAIMVGGVGGGFDTPARGLYPRLCEDLLDAGLGGLRLRFRNPTDLDEAVPDILAGMSWLAERGIGRVGLVGHSFGGAAVIQAAARSGAARAVVTLATQGYGTDPVRHLEDCPILLVHGGADEILPPSSSMRVHRLAPEPNRLVLLDGARHGLDEEAERVHQETRDWLIRHLKELPKDR